MGEWEVGIGKEGGGERRGGEGAFVGWGRDAWWVMGLGESWIGEGKKMRI